MKGRKPKPTELKKLAGNPGRRPLNENEAKIREGKPRCPSHLNDFAKRVWKRVAPLLYESGLLTLIDQDTLAAFCIEVGRSIEAELVVRETSSVIRNSNGNLIVNPWIRIGDRARDAYIRIGAEFGMSPSERSRLIVKIGEKEVSLAELLFEGASD